MQLFQMKVAFTGHRPNKLGGYNVNPIQIAVKEAIRDLLSSINPVPLVITGGALGVDTWAAQISLELQIPYIVAIPFRGQENAWPQSSKLEYLKILESAKETHVICEGDYAAWKMQTRNQWMVDNCDLLVGVFDGTPGGTANCIKYAEKKKKKTIVINPNNFK